MCLPLEKTLRSGIVIFTGSPWRPKISESLSLEANLVYARKRRMDEKTPVYH